MCKFNVKNLPILFKNNNFYYLLVPPKIIEEKSTINPSPITEGETLTLLCYVDGLPIPKVSWYFRKRISNNHANENELIFSYHKNPVLIESVANMVPLHEGNVLTIQNINRNYSGYFECIANNSVPPAASRKMKVTVECKNLI